MQRFVLLLLLLLLLLLGVLRTTNAANDNQRKSVQEIFNFLDESDKNFTLGDQKDVVLVLGTTGSGKTTLTLLLIGMKLIAVETSKGSGEFVIEDENGLVSPPEKTTQSQTIIPNLLVDKKANTTYYDCAGFEDSRGVDHDLSGTYLIQKLLKFTNSVKFIFTIPISSVRVGGDRHDFKKMVRHATALIKNIDKYRDAIAMVVTKADTRISNGQIVADEITIANVGIFVNRTRSDLESEDPQNKEKMEKFMDILLQEQDDKLNRIQIVRAPTEAGFFNEMQYPKQERQAIRTMLESTLKYTPTQTDDFGYTISSDSKLKIHGLFAELERSLLDDVVSIGNDIHDFYAHQISTNPSKKSLYMNLILCIEKLSQANADDLHLFEQQLINATSSLTINIPAESFKTLKRHIGFVYFLTSVSSVKLSSGFKISAGLKNVTDFMTASKDQYKLEMIRDTKAKLDEDVLKINAEMKAFYIRKENEITDINEIYDKILSDLKIISAITSREPDVFKRQLLEAVNSLRIQISADTLEQLAEHVEIVRFLESLDNSLTSVKFEIENDLNSSIQYLSVAKDWYQFSCKLHKIQSFYDVQHNPIRYNATALIETVNKLIKNNSEILFKDTGIKEFVDLINPETNAGMENITLNQVKLKSLNKLLQRTMPTPFTTSCTAAELVVKGYNIQIHDVLQIQCQANLTKIMALNKFFIDVSSSKAGHQFQIIAPIWEVLRPFEFALWGIRGSQGEPGSQGGHFFGIGDTFNGDNLRILSIGGQGGDTQTGKNGGCGGGPGKMVVIGLKGATNIRLDGLDGSSGAFPSTNCESFRILHPVGTAAAPRPPFVNEFKAYARENLANNVFESNLRKFIQDVESNKEVQSTYDILSFTNEILGLENKYWNLRNKFTFRPFYESILNRLTVYEKTLPEASPNRKVLSYLYAAAMSQVNSNIANQKTIIDLRDYLNEAQTHINDIRVIGRELKIRNQQVEYTNTLFSKMNAAKDLMNQKIFPQLDKNLEQIESNFLALVGETIEKKKHVRDEYERKLQEMKDSVRSSNIFAFLKIASAALCFLGPLGTAAGAVLGAGTSIAEAASGKPMDSSTIAQIRSSSNSVIKAFKYNNELFKQQLDDIESAIGSNEKLKDLREEIRKMKLDVQKADQDGSFSAIFNARTSLQVLVKNKKINIEKNHPQDITLMDIVNKIQNISKIVSMSLNMYNQIKCIKGGTGEVANSIESLQRELVALDQYQAQIYDTMIPMFRMAESYLKSQSESGGSHVQLDIKKWEIKNRLGDVKYMFGQMTAVSGTHDDFQHYFEKVQATMDILIDVYDRIESISNHAQFVDFISKIASNGQGFTTDPKLMDTINRMDEIIQTNLVLEKHELIVHAFKQHYFPFAPLFLDKFNLPPQLRFNDTEALRESAIIQIKDLNSGIIISEATLNSKDISLFDDIRFDSNASESSLPPFYIWRNDEFKREIRALLRGEKILIMADVSLGVNQNAIKFNRIGIQFKSPNETVQAKLNTAIQDFDLIMTMVGNNYYRCSNRVYHLPNDGNIVIEQSMKRDSNGILTKRNNVYKKISESNYFLSPYGLWNIKLESDKSAASLSTFENEVIDIELVGQGQYLKNTDAVARDVCNDQLDNYYFLDNVRDIQSIPSQ